MSLHFGKKAKFGASDELVEFSSISPAPATGFNPSPLPLYNI
jgi:hypothetical protein